MEELTVLLLTHPAGPVVLQALDALLLQERLPDRIVVSGLEPDDSEISDARSHALLADHGVELIVRDRLTDPEGEPPLWRVIEDARAELEARPRHWVWILHDDTVPEPEALAELIEATQRSSGVGVVGPKLVHADEPRRLLAVGHQITRGGRVVDSQVAHELDQGQHDQRLDVVGVPLAGMMIRSDVLDEVGGVDRAFDHGAEGLDLGWRSHLAGHRVVVATDAVLRQGAGGHPPPTLATRRRIRQLALARGSVWATPFRTLGILITSLLAALGLLLVKRPAEAAAEFADARAVLAPWRGLGARRRFRGRSRVRRRNLKGLFAPAASAWHGTSDTVHGALAGRGGSRDGAAALDTGPVSEEAESLESVPSRFRSLWSWPLVVALLVGVLAALVRWRDLLPALSGSSYGVQGGALHPILAGSSDVWHAWSDPWTGSGLGSDGDPAQWLLPMTGFTWVVEQLPWVDVSRSPAAVTVTWILFAALPLSVASAYFAARVGVRSRWVRALAGLIWAGMPPLVVAVDEGRLGPVIAHIALPLLVAGVVVAGSRRHGPLRTSATFATVLLAALVGLFAPAILVLITVAGLLVLAFGPGWGRLRGLVLAVLPWLLTGPWLARVVDDPRVVIGGAGAAAVGPSEVESWQAPLLHAGGGLSPTLWWTLPLVVLGVGAALRRGHRGRRAGALLVGALLGLAAALAAPLVRLGVVPPGHSDAGAVVTAWPGLFASVTAACLLLAAAQGAELPPRRGRAIWHRPLVAVLTGVVATAGLGTLAWSVWSGVGPQITQAPRPYPAVVTAQAEGPEAVRILDLSIEDNAVTYRLEGREPGLWVRDQVAEVVGQAQATSAAGQGSAAEPGRQALAATVLALTEPGDASDSSAEHEALLDLGVGYVGLRAPEWDPLIATLDATASLTRVIAADDLLLWRVGAAGSPDALVPPARVRLVDENGTPLAVVPVEGPRSVLRTSTEPPEETAALVVSEEAGWADVSQVRASGEVLEPVSGEWPLRYLVSPGAADQLQVELTGEDGTWRMLTAALAGLILFLALPFGSRRRRLT